MSATAAWCYRSSSEQLELFLQTYRNLECTVTHGRVATETEKDLHPTGCVPRDGDYIGVSYGRTPCLLLRAINIASHWMWMLTAHGPRGMVHHFLLRHTGASGIQPPSIVEGLADSQDPFRNDLLWCDVYFESPPDFCTTRDIWTPILPEHRRDLNVGFVWNVCPSLSGHIPSGVEFVLIRRGPQGCLNWLLLVVPREPQVEDLPDQDLAEVLSTRLHKDLAPEFSLSPLHVIPGAWGQTNPSRR
jgi:hypothetical protein